MTVWTGDYTDSDRVGDRLQGRILMSDFTQPNSVTPVVADEVIIMLGKEAEAEITQGLYSLGYAVPLRLTSETTQNILAAVAEKEIIYQVLISTDLKAQCTCVDGVELADLDKLIEEYGSMLETFLAGVKSCAIVLLEESRLEPPCESGESRVNKLPTSIGIITPRSRGWRHPSQIRF